MRKMLLFDIDGTLRDENFGIPQSAVRAVDLCRKLGHLVCICTGRSVSTIPDDVWDLKPDGVIAGGGCWVSYQGEKLLDRFFHREQLNRLDTWLREKEVSQRPGISLETPEKIFMNKKACCQLERKNELKWSGLDAQKRNHLLKEGKIRYQDNMAQFSPDQKVHKVCLWCEPGEYHQIRRLLEEPELVQEDCWEGQKFYELLPGGCHKGSGVEILRKAAAVERRDTVGFGDGKNDLDLLKAVGVSVAMENGAGEVKEAADSVCEAPMADGIYKELIRRKIIWEE